MRRKLTIHAASENPNVNKDTEIKLDKKQEEVLEHLNALDNLLYDEDITKLDNLGGLALYQAVVSAKSRILSPEGEE